MTFTGLVKVGLGSANPYLYPREFFILSMLENIMIPFCEESEKRTLHWLSELKFILKLIYIKKYVQLFIKILLALITSDIFQQIIVTHVDSW